MTPTKSIRFAACLAREDAADALAAAEALDREAETVTTAKIVTVARQLLADIETYQDALKGG